MNNVGSIVPKLIEAKRQAKKLVERAIDHVCYPHVCEPENAIALNVPYEGMQDRVYLCNYRVVHVCTVNQCERYLDIGDGTCPLSGINYGPQAYATSSYDKNDSRTWAKARVITTTTTTTTTIKKPLYRVPSCEVVRERIQTIVHNLIFSPKRAYVNEMYQQKKREQYQRAKDEHIRGCRQCHQFPIFSDLMRIHTHYMAPDRADLPIYDPDESLENYYTEIVWQVWIRIFAFLIPSSAPITGREIKPPGDRATIKVSVESITMSTMYYMQQGLSLNDLELLPRDDFLVNALPPIHDLVHFGISKTQITDGDYLITQTYHNAIERGVRRELLLDFTKLRETSRIVNGKHVDPVGKFYALGRERPKKDLTE